MTGALPERDGSRTVTAVKNESCLSIKFSHRLSGKLVSEDTIEMTALFGSLAFSGGNSVIWGLNGK